MNSEQDSSIMESCLEKEDKSHLRPTNYYHPDMKDKSHEEQLLEAPPTIQDDEDAHPEDFPI